MSTTTHTPPLAPRLRVLLRRLRWRIRLYTFVEGAAVLVSWVAIMFWLTLAMDYLPVLLGASEMPVAARAVLLGVVGLGAAYILFRWVLRRTFARMADHSMAVLLERRHQQFRDSLVTAVEMHEQPDHALQFNPEMLQHTGADALSRAPEVRLRRVFRWSPLWKSLGAALVLGGSVAAFALLPATSGAFQKAGQRIYLLDDQRWDRMAQLEVVGVTAWTIEHEPSQAIAENSLGDNRPKLTPIEVPFTESQVRLARGTSPKLVVRAEIREHRPPGSVTLHWQSGDESGQAKMTSGRRAREGYLYYSFSRTPLKEILRDVEFEARGFDFRTQPYRIEVVDAPAVTDVQVVYDRPGYLVDEERSVFKTVTAPLIAGTQLPRGSRATIVARANKPLKRVFVYDVDAKQVEVLEGFSEGDADAEEFRYTIDRLTRNVTLELMLIDIDDQVTQQPHIVAVGVQEDQPPQVNVAIKGIGTAVTPVVKFPAFGTITDDYWLERAWLELAVGDAPPRRLRLPVARGGLDEELIVEHELSEGANVYHWFDMRDERSRDDEPLELTPGEKLTLTVKAADRYDLDGFDVKDNPHAGSGERYQLDVVTPDELLVILERRELELRRRLEQIVEELTQMRDSLVRVKAEVASDESSASEPEEASGDPADSLLEPGDEAITAEEARRRAIALRRLRVQRAVNQSEKSRGETEGVGQALLDLVAQIENNRVDTEDRKERLREQVAAPLLAVVADDFPELDGRLAGLNELVNAGQLDRAQAATAADHALAQADDVLLKLDGVLTKMLDIESFNELIELVRALIEEQDGVIDETKTLRKKQLFGLE